MQSETGVWFMSELQKMRQANYEKGEKEPEKATVHLAKASGNAEVVGWILAHVAIQKDK